MLLEATELQLLLYSQPVKVSNYKVWLPMFSHYLLLLLWLLVPKFKWQA